jgi:hypothetical protein
MREIRNQEFRTYLKLTYAERDMHLSNFEKHLSRQKALHRNIRAI